MGLWGKVSATTVFPCWGETVQLAQEKAATTRAYTTPEWGSETRSSRVVFPFKVQGVSLVPGDARTFHQCYVHQQPDRPQRDPLMFLQQQSQHNAMMMQQMVQMTTAVVAFNEKGKGVSRWSEWWWPWRREFNVVSGRGSDAAQRELAGVCLERVEHTVQGACGFGQWLDQFSHWLNLRHEVLR